MEQTQQKDGDRCSFIAMYFFSLGSNKLQAFFSKFVFTNESKTKKKKNHSTLFKKKLPKIRKLFNSSNDVFLSSTYSLMNCIVTSRKNFLECRDTDLGKLEHVYQISLDAGAQPFSIATPTRLPQPIKQKVHKELKHLEKEDIIHQMKLPTD